MLGHKEDRMQIEEYLKKQVETCRCLEPVLQESMAYSLMAGGKRIRPMLTLAFTRLCGGDAEKALPFACAVEMIHTYSLIHDDLPCMDDDALRRGKPTNHTVYGEATALLAGDALLTLAFSCLSQAQLPADRIVRAVGELSHQAGAAGMVGGQSIDLQSEGKNVPIETLFRMDTGKTGALIQAACVLGCVAAGAEEPAIRAAREFAAYVGLAFQIRDDVLDVTGDANALGKNTGMDKERQKSTYVSLLGLTKAQKQAEELSEKAANALQIFGDKAQDLQDFARALAKRES